MPQRTLFRSPAALILTAFLCCATSARAQEMNVLTGESTVRWKASKVTGSHDGHVRLERGTLALKDGLLVLADVTVDMSSITCDDLTSESGNAKLVRHLKSADFFDVENHPVARFRTTRVERKADGTYAVTGDLTIKGVTAPNTFDAVVERTKDGVKATCALVFDRTVYDVRYGSGRFFEGLGDRMIHDPVELELVIVAC